jgi:hypothetical protein
MLLKERVYEAESGIQVPPFVIDATKNSFSLLADEGKTFSVNEPYNIAALIVMVEATNSNTEDSSAFRILPLSQSRRKLPRENIPLTLRISRLEN